VEYILDVRLSSEPLHDLAVIIDLYSSGRCRGGWLSCSLYGCNAQAIVMAKHVYSHSACAYLGIPWYCHAPVDDDIAVGNDTGSPVRGRLGVEIQSENSKNRHHEMRSVANGHGGTPVIAYRPSDRRGKARG
jgi:hypothetical protein